MSNIFLGDISNLQFKVGSDDCKVYLGDTLLYPQSTPVTKDYLRTVARDSGTISFTIGSAVTTSDLSYVAYSLDSGTTWTIVNNVNDTAITASTNVSNGDVVYWKGSGIRTANGSAQYNGVVYVSKFSSDAAFDVEGNAMSILFDDNFENQEFDSGSTYHLSSLFYSATTLVNASGLTLPATTVYDNDYNDMFNGCSGMTSIPSLPATTLGASCYKRMFRACTSLQSVPSNYLPITTLTESCYAYMFQGCTSLTTVPSDLLPARTATKYCYDNMFKECTSLTTAPNLPASTLANYCYRSMFLGCTSLTTAPILPAETLANYCYAYMFQNCTSLTTVPTLPATNLAQYCYTFMFAYCVSLTTLPSDLLPATSLAYTCYNSMFRGCVELLNSPILPATTLARACYDSMFEDCSSLNEITCLATDITAAYSTTNWVRNVASSGTFTKAASMSSWRTGYNGIPSGWTVQDYNG